MKNYSEGIEIMQIFYLLLKKTVEDLLKNCD